MWRWPGAWCAARLEVFCPDEHPEPADLPRQPGDDAVRSARGGGDVAVLHRAFRQSAFGGAQHGTVRRGGGGDGARACGGADRGGCARGGVHLRGHREQQHRHQGGGAAGAAFGR